MDTNVVAVRPRQTLIHAADNHGVAQIGPPQPKFSPRITRMNAKKNLTEALESRAGIFILIESRTWSGSVGHRSDD